MVGLGPSMLGRGATFACGSTVVVVVAGAVDDALDALSLLELEPQPPNPMLKIAAMTRPLAATDFIGAS